MTESKRTIPQIRADLYDQANALLVEAQAIKDLAMSIMALADETYRRSPVHKTKPTARRMTPKLRDDIRRFVTLNPAVPYREVARTFGVDGGRVSEAVAGFRGGE